MEVLFNHRTEHTKFSSSLSLSPVQKMMKCSAHCQINENFRNDYIHANTLRKAHLLQDQILRAETECSVAFIQL